MKLTAEEIYTIIAFIRNHEPDEIPEDIWDVLEKLERRYEDETC